MQTCNLAVSELVAVIMKMPVRNVVNSSAFGNSSVDLVVCAGIFRPVCSLVSLGRGAAQRDHSSSGPGELAERSLAISAGWPDP